MDLPAPDPVGPIGMFELAAKFYVAEKIAGIILFLLLIPLVIWAAWIDHKNK